MGYQMPIVCKEIYILALDERLTLDEYKERTGLDLKPYIELDDGNIYLNIPPYTKGYIVNTEHNVALGNPAVAFAHIVKQTKYVGGTTSGECKIGFDNSDTQCICAIMLEVDKNSEFTIENVEIKALLY